jgi:twinkle protein
LETHKGTLFVTRKKKQQESDSNLVTKGPCNSCGSSDACGIYDDGHTFCFSCNAYGEEGDMAKKPTKKAKDAEGLLPVGDYSAWQARKLTEETCRKWGISLSEMSGQPVRVFNYKNTEGGTVAQKVRGKGKDFKFIGDTPNCGLFGQHLWRDGGKKVVVTEGEIDAASVSQVQGHKWPVVSVPNGAAGARKSLQKSLDWLAKFDEVILMFDTDDAGQKVLPECAALFKPGQCKIAKLPLKDANDMLKAGRGSEIVDAIWGAKEYRPDGIVLGTDLWDRLTEETTTFSTAYPWQGLQEKTLGARRGELVTLTAGSGIGKSSIVREIAYHLQASGERIGMMMFEETVKRTALGLMGIHANKSLTLVSQPSKEQGFKEAYDAVIAPGRVVMYDHFGSTKIENVLERIRYMAKALDCSFVFVDHLSILISGMEDGDERRMIDNAMTALKTLAMEANVGIFLVSHLKRPEGKGHENGAETSLSQLRGSHAIAQLSDIVIGVERNQQDEKLKNYTRIRVLKNRFTGETGVAGFLRYERETGRLSELLEDPFQEGYDFNDETGTGADGSPY